MHALFLEPSFPRNQLDFVRALHQVAARVTGIGESAVEAQILPAANVRETCTIPGTSVRAAYVCRDEPAMKAALRAAGIPCAQSTGADTPEAVREFARRVGFPVNLEPRDAAGAAGTHRAGKAEELESAMRTCRVDRGARVVAALGTCTSATHMEWFFGPKGLKLSETWARAITKRSRSSRTALARRKKSFEPCSLTASPSRGSGPSPLAPELPSARGEHCLPLPRARSGARPSACRRQENDRRATDRSHAPRSGRCRVLIVAP